MSPVVPAAVLSAIAALALLVSRSTRGHRRLTLQRGAIFLGVPAVTATLVLAPLEIDASFSDALSLAGLVVSLMFGLGARTLDLRTLRMRMGVVIPSRVPFHTELRAGLRQGLTPVRVEFYDDYIVNSRAKENLSEFIPSLRRTLAWRPDYLVVCSPSSALLSDESVLRELTRFRRRGGGIVFIDNPPDADAAPQLGRFGLVRADVECAAKVLSEYVSSNVAPSEDVLVLSGPPSSEPAERFRRELEQRLPAGVIAVGDPNGWTGQATYDALERYLDGGMRPRFVLCGNDVMAFGAVRAVRDAKAEGDVEVLGYNGIARALFAIAEQANPFCATICVPPAAYGQEIAAMVTADAQRIFGRPLLRERCIPIDAGQLVHRGNVELYLDD